MWNRKEKNKDKDKEEKENMTQRTQKVRIFPTDEQKEVLWTLSERCRLIYNFGLAERKDAFKNGKNISYIDQQNDLPETKKKYPEYRWVYSKVLQGVLQKLDADFRSFFALRKNGDKDAEPPGFKGKKHFTTIDFNQSGFKIKDGKIKFSHSYKDVPLEFDIPEKFGFSGNDKKVKQVSIFRSKDGDFYFSITYDETLEKEYIDNGLYQAFDLGLSKQTAVNIDSKFFETKNRRPEKYWEKKIEKAQSRLDHCKCGSGRWNRIKKSIRTMQKKAANQRKDSQHRLSRKIVANTKANTIIIGDLDVKEMAQEKEKDKSKSPLQKARKRGLNRGTQNTGSLSRFTKFLTYKAEEIGKKVIRIDEKYTTKTCCVCGKKHKMNIWDRTFKCPYCRFEIDRDRNSAINIMLRFLIQNAKWASYRLFVGNLRKTGIPIKESYS